MAKQKKESEEAGSAPMAQAGSGDPAAVPSAGGAHVAPAGDAAPTQDTPSSDGDKQQDIDLFKQLIAQYCPEHADSNEAHAMAQSTYHEAVASGMPHDEAMKCAGYGLKAASLHGMKQARETNPPSAKPQDTAGALPGKEGIPPVVPGQTTNAPMAQAGALPGLPPPKAAQSKDADSDGGTNKEAHKEATIVRLTAELAQLRESAQRADLVSHLDTILKESGMPVSVTKAFRDLVKSERSKEKIDASWKIFKEAFKGSSSGSGFALAVEKQTYTGNSGAAGSGFSDCIK